MYSSCYFCSQAGCATPRRAWAAAVARLQNREIDFIADFMFAEVIGNGPMDHAKCIDFWGREAEACGEFPK
jgi:hypothetical protein